MKYRANPVLVDAFQIAHVGRADADGGRKIYHSEGSAYANAALLARIEPEPGDYWVVQADGYCYLNPRDVFERKYAKVDGAEKLLARIEFWRRFSVWMLVAGCVLFVVATLLRFLAKSGGAS